LSSEAQLFLSAVSSNSLAHAAENGIMSVAVK